MAGKKKGTQRDRTVMSAQYGLTVSVDKTETGDVLIMCWLTLGKKATLDVERFDTGDFEEGLPRWLQNTTKGNVPPLVRADLAKKGVSALKQVIKRYF